MSRERRVAATHIALRSVLSALAFLSGLAWAEPVTKAQVTIIDLSVEASRNAPNDLARATAYFEAQDANPAELARRVNRAIMGGFETAKAYTAVKARSGGSSTWPVYGKGGRNIEAWRMRSEILLEARDTAALSELLGRLQSTLAIGQLTLQPAPETRRKVEDEATLEAISAFQAKAKLIAQALGKPQQLRQLAINAAGREPVRPMLRQAPMSMASDAAPAPIEGGDSAITVTVTGQIELPVD